MMAEQSIVKKANLFLVAAPRSGSTQLATWLNECCSISIGAIKEPNYFSSQDFSSDYVRKTHLNDVDPEKYFKKKMESTHQFAVFRKQEHYDYLFENLDSEWKLDASTSYLHSLDAPKRVYSYNSNARIIILLRDPIARAISHYRLAIRTGRSQGSITDELQKELLQLTPIEGRYLIRLSKYSDAVGRWMDMFPQGQVKLLLLEDLITSPRGVVSSICNWLGVQAINVSLKAKNKNASASPRFPVIHHVMQRYGIKSYVSRLITPVLKDRLRSILFNNSVADITNHEKCQLAELLIDDAEIFRSSISDDVAIHRSVSNWSVFKSLGE